MPEGLYSPYEGARGEAFLEAARPIGFAGERPALGLGETDDLDDEGIAHGKMKYWIRPLKRYQIGYQLHSKRVIPITRAKARDGKNLQAKERPG